MEETQKIVKKNKGLIVTLVIALITAGAGFYGGIQYQKTQKIAGNPPGIQANLANGSGRTTNGNGNGNMGKGVGQPVNGEITSIDTTGITVKTADGSSKIVLISSSTKISIAAAGSTSDLKEGDNVMIIGTTGTDGTVSATTVSIGGDILKN